MNIGFTEAQELLRQTRQRANSSDQDRDEAPIAVAMAKAAASDVARQLAGTGIQLHGGVGMTWVHDLQLYFKRAKAAELPFGDAARHRLALPGSSAHRGRVPRRPDA